MEFKKSGLPDRKDIHRAFDHAYADATSESQRREMEKTLLERAAVWRRDNTTAIENASIDETNKQALRQQLDSEYNTYMSNLPVNVKKGQEAFFIMNCMANALIVTTAAAQATDDMIALALLHPGVRSAHDLREIGNKLGGKYAAVLEEVQHINAYPNIQPELLRHASPAAKSLFIVTESRKLQLLHRHYGELLAQGAAMPRFVEGEEQRLFDNLKAAWGADKGLDAFYVARVNELCAVLSSPFRIEVVKNQPSLIQLATGLPPNGARPSADPSNPNIW